MIVRGYCPMGCGETLELRTQQLQPGEIWCTSPDCPRPSAVTDLLADAAEHQHIVQLDEYYTPGDEHWIWEPMT